MWSEIKIDTAYLYHILTYVQMNFNSAKSSPIKVLPRLINKDHITEIDENGVFAYTKEQHRRYTVKIQGY